MEKTAVYPLHNPARPAPLRHIRTNPPQFVRPSPDPMAKLADQHPVLHFHHPIYRVGAEPQPLTPLLH